MSAWLPIPIPHIAERFIAFTIPDERCFLGVSYEGIHEVTFEPRISVHSDLSPQCKTLFTGKQVAWQGKSFATFGLYGGQTLVADNSAATLAIEPASQSNDTRVDIWSSDGQLIQSLPFTDLSGDWQYATYSADFRHILICTPYTIALYRRT